MASVDKLWESLVRFVKYWSTDIDVGHIIKLVRPCKDCGSVGCYRMTDWSILCMYLWKIVHSGNYIDTK